MRTNISGRIYAEAPDAIQTALRTAARDSITKYVVPTAYGLKISNTPPPGRTRRYEANPDGTLYLTDE